MAVDILSRFPVSFFAGDTIRVNHSDGDHPSSSWTLQVVLRSGTATKTFEAAAGTSDSFDIVLPSAQSVNIPPGVYTVSLVYTETATNERITDADVWQVTVAADLTKTPEVSIDRQTLENGETALRDLIGKKYQSVNFNGQSFTLADIEKLQNAIERIRARVYRAEGRTGLRRVLARL